MLENAVNQRTVLQVCILSLFCLYEQDGLCTYLSHFALIYSGNCECFRFSCGSTDDDDDDTFPHTPTWHFWKNCAVRSWYLTNKNDGLSIAMYVENWPQRRIRVIKLLMLIHKWYAADRFIVWAPIQTRVRAACLVVAKVSVCFVSRKSIGHTERLCSLNTAGEPNWGWKAPQTTGGQFIE